MRKKDHLKLIQKSGKMSPLKKAIRLIFRLVLLLAILLLLKNGEAFFRINEIRVEGAGLVPAADIIEASGIKKGKNMFMLKESTISDKIQKHFPRVEKVEIDRFLPDTIVISITERTLAGYILTDDGLWLIDQDAFCFASAAEPGSDYPLLVGVADELIVPGAYLGCPVRREALVNLFTIWPGQAELELVKINLSDRDNLIVHTVKDLEIWLGDGKEMESKVILIQHSIPYINSNPGTHLDVRSGKRLVVSKNAVISEKEVEP